MKDKIKKTLQKDVDETLFYDKSVVKIIVFASTVIIFSIILMGILVYTITHNEVVHKLKNNDLRYIAQSISSKINGRINQAIESSLLLARDPEVIRWVESREQDQQLAEDVIYRLEHLASDYHYTNSFIASVRSRDYWSEDGIVIETLSEADPDDTWFFESLQSKTLVNVNIDYNAQYGETFAWINTLMGDVNQPIAVAGVGLSLDSLSNEFQSFTYGETSNLWLMDETGEIYLSNDIEHNGQSIDSFVPSEMKVNILQTFDKEYDVFEYKNHEGHLYDLISYPLEATDLKLVLQIKRSETVSFLDTIKLHTLIAVIVAFISIVLVFYLISHKLANPYKRALEINKTLEQKVDERTRELTEKNKKILDSINYAKRIQQSVLPRQHSVNDFFQDYFITWHPKDRVGGDFYWSNKLGDDHLLAVGDCTGHGVPGALMTMLSISLLNHIVDSHEQECRDNPANVLKMLNNSIKETLNQEDKTGMSDDGLDIALCYIKPNRKVIFAGARLSLFVKTDDDKIIEYKGDRKSIGYRRTPKDFKFTNIRLEASENDRFYLTTDGLIDQNGGENNFCFGKKRFEQLITRFHELSFTEQKDIFEQELKSFMNQQPQRDDITFVGFKL